MKCKKESTANRRINGYFRQFSRVIRSLFASVFWKSSSTSITTALRKK